MPDPVAAPRNGARPKKALMNGGAKHLKSEMTNGAAGKHLKNEMLTPPAPTRKKKKSSAPSPPQQVRENYY